VSFTDQQKFDAAIELAITYGLALGLHPCRIVEPLTKAVERVEKERG